MLPAVLPEPAVLPLMPELEAPLPIAELDDSPVPPGVVVESAPAAGEGVGVGAGVGAAIGALGAGGGVVTVFSSFLQAVRPTANRAAIRMERVILYFPLGGGELSFMAKKRSGLSHRLNRYPDVMAILAALSGK